MFPFGVGGGWPCRMNGFCEAPGGAEGARPMFTTGSGSTSRTAGTPVRMKSVTLFISSSASVDGSTTSSPSTSSVIIAFGWIWTTSYCLRSSSTTDHSGELRMVWKSRPPKIRSSLEITPIRFLSVFATTRMLRASSYSTGRPRSKNGITCSSAAQVNATPMKTSLTPVRAEVTLGISRGMMPNFSRASRADSVNGSVSSTST